MRPDLHWMRDKWHDVMIKTYGAVPNLHAGANAEGMDRVLAEMQSRLAFAGRRALGDAADSSDGEGGGGGAPGGAAAGNAFMERLDSVAGGEQVCMCDVVHMPVSDSLQGCCIS